MLTPRLAVGLLPLVVLVCSAAALAAPHEAWPHEAAPDVRAPEVGPAVAPGAVVHLEFTLRDEHGTLLEDTRGRPPLVFTYGRGEVIPGLERGLAAMTAGETKRISVAADEAYGPVDPTAFTELPAARVPPEARVVGTRLLAHTRSGREVTARVHEVRDGTVVLDLNHPLAGKTLVFDVRVVLVEAP